MKDWLILLCIGIAAVYAFHERDRWLPHPASPVPVVSDDKPPQARQSEPALTLPAPPPPAEIQLTPDSPAKAELANLVGQSQRLALAKYPALGVATSEINIRFNYRYKRMLAEYSPRLQDPAWPELLADECARDAGIHPVAAPSTPPPALPVAAASRTASLPPGTPSPASGGPAPSLRAPPGTPAAAQTLVFHPAFARGPQLAPAGPATVSAPPSGDALPFVTMDAVNQSSGNHYTYNWGSYYGWYDISFRQSVGIAISVRNMSRTSAAVNLRWIFFARNPHSSERFIFAAAGKELDLPPGESTSVAAASPLIQSREINYGWIGDRYMYGSKYEGWLVQLLERGSQRVIKQTGSTSYLEDLAKRSDFSAVIEDYRAKSHVQGSAGL